MFSSNFCDFMQFLDNKPTFFIFVQLIIFKEPLILFKSLNIRFILIINNLLDRRLFKSRSKKLIFNFFLWNLQSLKYQWLVNIFIGLLLFIMTLVNSFFYSFFSYSVKLMLYTHNLSIARLDQGVIFMMSVRKLGYTALWLIMPNSLFLLPCLK